MTTTPEPESTETGAPDEGQNRPEIITELQELGRQLESTFRAFVAGPGQTIRREIGEGLQELGSQVQRAVSVLQSNPQASELGQRARNVAHQVQQAPAVREVEETLVSGLQSLNQQLSRLVDRFETQPDEAPSEPAVQQLTIETDDQPLNQASSTDESGPTL